MFGLGGLGFMDVYYFWIEKYLEGGGFYFVFYNMCFENSDNLYGMFGYFCYFMYDRLEFYGFNQLMNFVFKQFGFCVGSNGFIYQFY